MKIEKKNGMLRMDTSMCSDALQLMGTRVGLEGTWATHTVAMHRQFLGNRRLGVPQSVVFFSLFEYQNLITMQLII